MPSLWSTPFVEIDFDSDQKVIRTDHIPQAQIVSELAETVFDVPSSGSSRCVFVFLIVLNAQRF